MADVFLTVEFNCYRNSRVGVGLKSYLY